MPEATTVLNIFMEKEPEVSVEKVEKVIMFSLIILQMIMPYTNHV